jgi:uncharacterized iron-regulated membrane protein
MPRRAGARRLRLREVWVRLHLVLAPFGGPGRSCSPGITGSVLVFYVELDRWLDPATSRRRRHDAAAAIARGVFRALRAAHPERDGSWRLEMPLSDTAPVTARYYRAGGDGAPRLRAADRVGRSGARWTCAPAGSVGRHRDDLALRPPLHAAARSHGPHDHSASSASC